MKKRYAKIVVPVLMGVLCAAPLAFADNGDIPLVKSYTEEVNVSLNDHVDTSVSRASSSQTFIRVDGSVLVTGEIDVDSSISALVDNKQINHENHVQNYLHENTAGTDEENGVLENATGNIGLNMAAGDNNLQDNAAAMAASDSDFVFDAADATVVVNQDAVANGVCNHGSTNSAGLGGNSLASASGNIGVNIAAGNSNLQKNNMSATAAAASLATATVAVMQQAGNNHTGNMGHYDMLVNTIGVTLDGGVSQRGSANITGSYTGTSDQYGDLYLDTWDGDTHTGGSQTGHIDFDNVVQAQLPDGTALSPSDIDPAGDGGPLLLNSNGTTRASMSDLSLSGSFSGQIVDINWVAAPTINTAGLDGNVLQNASGNIGVNIAAGTNNLQSNNLAMIANTMVPDNGGGNGGE